MRDSVRREISHAGSESIKTSPADASCSSLTENFNSSFLRLLSATRLSRARAATFVKERHDYRDSRLCVAASRQVCPYRVQSVTFERSASFDCSGERQPTLGLNQILLCLSTLFVHQVFRLTFVWKSWSYASTATLPLGTGIAGIAVIVHKSKSSRAVKATEKPQTIISSNTLDSSEPPVPASPNSRRCPCRPTQLF